MQTPFSFLNIKLAMRAPHPALALGHLPHQQILPPSLIFSQLPKLLALNPRMPPHVTTRAEQPMTHRALALRDQNPFLPHHHRRAVLERAVKICANPRIVHFIWLVAHGGLATKDNLFSRIIVPNPFCMHCPNIVESNLQVFRDCPFARSIWNCFLPSSSSSLFFSQPLPLWLQSNCHSHCVHSSGIPWAIILSFGLMLHLEQPE